MWKVQCSFRGLSSCRVLLQQWSKVRARDGGREVERNTFNIVPHPSFLPHCHIWCHFFFYLLTLYWLLAQKNDWHPLPQVLYFSNIYYSRYNFRYDLQQVPHLELLLQGSVCERSTCSCFSCSLSAAYGGNAHFINPSIPENHYHRDDEWSSQHHWHHFL